MTEREQKAAAKAFIAFWTGKGYEKGQSQPFWMSLLGDVLGVEHPEQYISFENQVVIDHTSFIDGVIPTTHVLIEQKSLGKNLKSAIKQSDGSRLTPFQQAKRYSSEQPYSNRPRWVVTCNFSEFHIYDMERPQGEPEVIFLKDLERECYRLRFLVDTENKQVKQELEVSKKAGELVGVLYDALLKEYTDPTNPASLQSLNMLCVRLVFCLYAEDAGLFGQHGKFHDYLVDMKAKDVRKALLALFQILDTPVSERDPYEDAQLASFPYVNGGLFAEEKIEIPNFTPDIFRILLEDASANFDWSQISPTIFGAIFESTLNPETRRSGGMHYTSIENIHKVIDPLFYEGLKTELDTILAHPVEKTQRKQLKSFQEKLASLRFLDPACGSGNFLTETYISLRRLENQVLELLAPGQMTIELYDIIQVSISQFYGIELNDFAVTVAKTALWIAESQMMQETETIIHKSLDFLPLKSYANIYEGNALQMDWTEVVAKDELDYIMGNPPFVGYSRQSKEQKQDILSVYQDEKGKSYKTAGKLDYVSGWYFKAAQYMWQTTVHTAFVSTNSITQGEQVAGVWKPLYERFGVHIDFAYQTFKWESEASEQAAVHCVIVGFSTTIAQGFKKLFLTDTTYREVENISPYLTDSPTVFIESRNKPLWDVPNMTTGNRPADGGHLIIEQEDYADFIAKEPNAIKYIRKLTGALEYINGKERYCLWLVGVSPAELKKMPLVLQRVSACRQARLGGAPDRQKLADTPSLFRETKNPETALLFPNVSSENRKYIPIGFIDNQVITTDLVRLIPDATKYDFGILTSNVHMAWMRVVCGRLKSDYRYSKDIVYNNFPWPTPTDSQKAKIEATAQAILDARNLYPDSSLADLYDETTMPPELRKAHQLNDKAVMAAYGFPVKGMTESLCVAALMKRYQAKVQELEATK